MRRKLTPPSPLENLKKEAKRWLKALRANDPEARARLERANPQAPAEPTLRDIQHALAREHGLPGWTALQDQLADDARATRSHAERVAGFLQAACPDHQTRGGPAHVIAPHVAQRMLRRHPEIARDSLYTAIVCGELEEVERLLKEWPAAASEKGGPKGWEPLLYLCFTRLPLAAAAAHGGVPRLSPGGGAPDRAGRGDRPPGLEPPGDAALVRGLGPAAARDRTAEPFQPRCPESHIHRQRRAPACGAERRA